MINQNSGDMDVELSTMSSSVNDVNSNINCIDAGCAKSYELNSEVCVQAVVRDCQARGHVSSIQLP